MQNLKLKTNDWVAWSSEATATRAYTEIYISIFVKGVE